MFKKLYDTTTECIHAIHKQSSYALKKLYDTKTESIHAIHNFDVDTNTWDPLLVHLLSKKLDLDTYSDYKKYRKEPLSWPSLEELITFIEAKFTALQPIQRKDKKIPTILSNQHIKVTSRLSTINYLHRLKHIKIKLTKGDTIKLLPLITLIMHVSLA